MYCDFYGFKELPFAITPNPRFIFLSKNHREAFAHLLYGIDSHAGFIELTGEVGSGKTTILRSLLGQLDDSKHRSALIFNPKLSADELLRTINREFGILATGTIDELMHALNQFLLLENASSRTVVLVIDESQNLDPAVLEQIRMISNLETDTDKLIQIVLAGQPELGKLLESDNLRQLNQRIKVRFHLLPLDFEDMVAYIDHRLEIAGGWKAATFTPRALKMIFRHSKGLPRLINVLCDRALLIGFTEERREISHKMISTALHELKRENLSPRSHQLLWQVAVAILITIALVSAGFITGRHIKPAAKVVVDIGVNADASNITFVQLVRKDLENISDIDCAMQSFNELATLWNFRPVVAYKGETVKRGLEHVSARRGVRLLYLTGARPGDILKTESPCLLELRLPGMSGTRFIALTRFESGQYVLVSPVSKKSLPVSEAELGSIWTGTAFIPWRNPHNLPENPDHGNDSKEIRTLQNMLAKAGTFSGKTTGTFDKATQESVRKFQANHQIPVDGMPGPRTLLHLYRASRETTEPSLTRQERT